MKIVFLITGLGVGGAERQVVDLCDEYVALGHEVYLLYLSGDARILPSSPKVHVVGLRMTKSFFSFLRGYLKAREVICKISPQVLHSHMVHANLFARLLRLSVPIPTLISSAHSSNEGGVLRMLLYRVTDFLSDLTTNVSQEAVRSFIRKKAVPHSKIVVMYNGIDTEKFSPSMPGASFLDKTQLGLKEDDRLILAIGRFNKAKDYPNLIRAFSIIADKRRNVFLAIVGDGELRPQIEQLADSCGLRGRVLFLGVQLDVRPYIRLADVFVLSSEWEGFSLVVAEAMACGCIVVSTDCGGPREIIGDKGYLVPPKEPNSLAQGVERALSLGSEQRNLLAQEARDRIVQNYSLKKIAQKWLKLYEGR